MEVSKWGDSLAIRLPASLVEALALKEGDQVELRAAGERELEVSRDEQRQRALETLRSLRRPLPADYKFNREELYERK